VLFRSQAKISGDVVVEVPIESQRGKLQILTGAAELETGAPSGPLAKRVEVKLKAPAGADNVDDLSRFAQGLAEATGEKLDLEIDLPALQTLPQALRKSHWKIEALLGYTDSGAKLIELLPAPKKQKPAYGLAVGRQVEVAAARRDGFTDFLGMTTPGRRLRFGGRESLSLPLASAGVVDPPAAPGWSVLAEGSGLRYSKLVLRDGVPVGALVVGDVELAGRLQSFVRKGIPRQGIPIQGEVEGHWTRSWFSNPVSAPAAGSVR